MNSGHRVVILRRIRITEKLGPVRLVYIVCWLLRHPPGIFILFIAMGNFGGKAVNEACPVVWCWTAMMIFQQTYDFQRFWALVYFVADVGNFRSFVSAEQTFNHHPRSMHSWYHLGWWWCVCHLNTKLSTHKNLETILVSKVGSFRKLSDTIG